MASTFRNSSNSEEFWILGLLDIQPFVITKPWRPVLVKLDYPERNESHFVNGGQEIYITQILLILSILGIYQFRVFGTIFQSFAISSIFELDTSSFGFWAFFHVILRVFFKTGQNFKTGPSWLPKVVGRICPPRGSQGKNTPWLIGLKDTRWL